MSGASSPNKTTCSPTVWLSDEEVGGGGGGGERGGGAIFPITKLAGASPGVTCLAPDLWTLW